MDYSETCQAWIAKAAAGIALPEAVRLLLQESYYAGADDALRRVSELNYTTDPAYVPQYGSHELAEARAENALRGRMLVDAARQCRVDNLRRYRD